MHNNTKVQVQSIINTQLATMIRPLINIFLVVLLSEIAGQVDAFGVKEPVSALLQKHVSEIARLKEETQAIVGADNFDQVPYNNDVFYLRYCLEGDKDVEDLKKNLAWRQGEGKKICDAATSAFVEATAGEGWNNDPIRNNAPSAEIINQYLTESSGMTTSTSDGDFLYCIRAGMIDDKALMSLIDVDSLVDFFVYAKEIISLAANDRSLTSDRISNVLTVNDLNGLQLIGGDSTFRDALSASSKKANELYPALGGPTLLLNLPRLVSALVKVFTPLFPKKVRENLKFSRGCLKDVTELKDARRGGKDNKQFLKDVDDILSA